RAVPGALGLIPGYQTAHVGAHRRPLDRHARLVPVDRDAFSVQVEHAAGSTRHGPERLALRAGDAIADQVVRVVLVLTQVVPDAAANALAGRVEEIGPRVFQTEDPIGRHHPGQRAT